MPVYKKRATKVKKPPRIVQTQRTQQKVSQRVVVHIEQPKPKPRVRKAAPRAMGRDYQLKALLTRPMMPTPAQAGFDAAEVARQIASQEQKLNTLLEQNAMQVIRQQQVQQPGYYGTQVLQMGPPGPQPEGGVLAEPTTAPPPPPPPAQMTEEQKEAARAVKVATEELGELKSKKTQATFLGLTDEELEAARKKLKRPGPRQPKVEKEKEKEKEKEAPLSTGLYKPPPSKVVEGAKAPPPSREKSPEPPKKEEETPAKKTPGRKATPEGVFDRRRMDVLRSWVKGDVDPTSSTLKDYAKRIGVKPPKGLDARGSIGQGNRRAFAKKMFEKLKREGLYESNEP